MQIVHAGTFTFGNGVELLDRLLLTVNLEGGIAEQLGAGSVPTCEGGEQDFLAF